MALPARITVPAALALLAAAVIGGILLWQLDRTRAMLQDMVTETDSGSGTAVQPLVALDAPSVQGNKALTALRAGDLLALRGEWTEAEHEYRAAVEAGGGLTALRKLAQAQLQRRDTAGARETLKQLKAAGARDEDLVLLESIIHLRSGELDEARGLLERADDAPQKHYGAALLAIVEGKHDKAKTELAAVSAGWEPTLRGYAQAILGAYEEYELFANSPPTHRDTLLARALADAGECELALPMLAAVLVQNDDYRDAWIVQGYCQLTSERIEEAKTSLERAYQIDPQKPEVSYFLARTFIRLGDHAAAITYLRYALENGFSPAADARRLLASEALQTGDTATALEQLDLLTTDTNATPEAFADFVTAAVAADKEEEAYAKAQEAVRRHPQSALAHELLGWTAAETSRIDEARTELTKALELDPSLESARERLNEL